LGGAILLGSIAGIIVYGTLLYFWPILILEITAFLGVVVLLVILGWIGWTMATTPTPEPLAETPPASTGAKGSASGEKPANPAQGTPKADKQV